MTLFRATAPVPAAALAADEERAEITRALNALSKAKLAAAFAAVDKELTEASALRESAAVDRLLIVRNALMGVTL